MQAVAQGMDAVDAVRLVLEGSSARVSDGDLGELADRLERVRHLGGRVARGGVGPEVAGMLKAVGRSKLVC